MEDKLMLIAGEWVPASDGATRESTNPATGEVLGCAPLATKEDVDRALDAAQEGKKLWAAMTRNERCGILRKAADIFDGHLEELAQMVTAEMGKPIGMARSEAAEIPTLLRLSASAAEMMSGETVIDQNERMIAQLKELNEQYRNETLAAAISFLEVQNQQYVLLKQSMQQTVSTLRD